MVRGPYKQYDFGRFPFYAFTAPLWRLFHPDPDKPVLSSPLDASGHLTATDPNSPGQATELMVQKLVNIRRALTSRYSHLAFVSFEPGSLTVELVLAPGAYAFSFRLVEIATGRVSLPLECGVLAVS